MNLTNCWIDRICHRPPLSLRGGLKARRGNLLSFNKTASSPEEIPTSAPLEPPRNDIIVRACVNSPNSNLSNCCTAPPNLSFRVKRSGIEESYSFDVFGGKWIKDPSTRLRHFCCMIATGNHDNLHSLRYAQDDIAGQMVCQIPICRTLSRSAPRQSLPLW